MIRNTKVNGGSSRTMFDCVEFMLINKSLILVYCIFVFLCLPVKGDGDLTIHFWLDDGGATRAQSINDISAKTLIEEISLFIRECENRKSYSRIGILVDTFWQKGEVFDSKGIFDYRLGQHDKPKYDELRSLNHKWLNEKETSLNKLVNRLMPNTLSNTITIVLSNSNMTLKTSEIETINSAAEKVNSNFILVTLPRDGYYGNAALEPEIRSLLRKTMEDVKKFITAKFSKLDALVFINGKKYDSIVALKEAEVVAPAELEFIYSGENVNNLLWECNGRQYGDKKLSLKLQNAGMTRIFLRGHNSVGQKMECQFDVNVLAKPKASFTCTPLKGTAPLLVKVVSTSENARTFQWNWGDGTQSGAGATASHTYNQPGQYKLSMTATGEKGQTDTAEQTVNVTIASAAAFDAVQYEAIIAGEEVAFVNKSKNFDVCSWDFGDGSAASNQNEAKHVFAKAGEYLVTLTITNAAGGKAKATRQIMVGEPLKANFENVADEKNTESISFKNRSTSAVRYHWDFGDGYTSDDETPTHEFYFEEDDKIFTVTLTAYSKNGKSDTCTKRISVEKSKERDVGGGVVEPIDIENPPRDSELNPPVKEESDDEGGGAFVFVIIMLLLVASGVVVFLKMRKKAVFVVKYNSSNGEAQANVLLGNELSLDKVGGPAGLKLMICKPTGDDPEYKVKFKYEATSKQPNVKQGGMALTIGSKYDAEFELENLTVENKRLVIVQSDDDNLEEDN